MRILKKKEFKKIVNDEIFIPLAMKNSTFDYRLPNEEFQSVASGHLKKNKVIEGNYFILQPLGFGGLWSTPTDLAKFLIEIQRSLKGDSNQILSQKNVALMLKPVRNSKVGPYGLGFTIGQKRFGNSGHNLGYFSTMIAGFDGGYGLVIMTNSENGQKAQQKIRNLIGRRYWGW